MPAGRFWLKIRGLHARKEKEKELHPDAYKSTVYALVHTTYT